MNRWQIGPQVRYLIQQLRWPDSAVVFPEPCVLVTEGIAIDIHELNRFPLALIRPGAISIDPKLAEERPDLVDIEFAVTIVVANAGDKYGETTLLGANRTGGSNGRGLLEVEEKVMSALFQLGPASGLPIAFRGAGDPAPTYTETPGYIATGDYRFKASGTLSRTYQKPAGFKRTGSGSSVVLSWNAATRFDFRRFILRRASGSTPPATSAAGTGVTLGGSPDGGGTTPPTTVTDSPGAGTWSYSLFSVYDDANASSDVATSAAQTLSGLVVT